MKFLFLLIPFLLFAEDLKIRSDYFSYKPQERISIFKTDVNVTKGKDKILADEIKIFFDENKKPLKMVAKGDVRFVISLDENNSYKGKSEILIYDLNSSDIILEGNASILRLETNESVKGSKIILNKTTKQAEVIGDKKPIEIIIKVK